MKWLKRLKDALVILVMGTPLYTTVALASASDSVQACSQSNLRACLKSVDVISYANNITDLSVLYLSELFGGSVSILPERLDSLLLSHLLGVFSTGVWSVVILIIGYIAMLGALRSSTDGTPMGKAMTPIVLIRAFFGVVLLLPQKTGYSVVQMFIMFVVLKGVWLADHIWDITLNVVETVQTKQITEDTWNKKTKKEENKTQSIYSSYWLVQGASAVKSAHDLRTVLDGVAKLLMSQTCMYDLKNMYDTRDKMKFPEDDSFSLHDGGGIGDLGYAYYFGGNSTDYDSPAYRGRCGVFPYLPAGIDPKKAVQGVSTKEKTFMDFEKSGMYLAAKQLMYSWVPADIAKYNDRSSADILKKIGTMPCSAIPGSRSINKVVCQMMLATQYYLSVVNIVGQAAVISDAQKAALVEARKEGWLMAGRYYFDLINKRQTQNVDLTGFSGKVWYRKAKVDEVEKSTIEIWNDKSSFNPFKWAGKLMCTVGISHCRKQSDATPPPVITPDQRAAIASAHKTAWSELSQQLSQAQRVQSDVISGGDGLAGLQSYMGDAAMSSGSFLGMISNNVINNDMTTLFKTVYSAALNSATSMRLSNLDQNPLGNLQKLGAIMMGSTVDFWLTTGQHIFDTLSQTAWKYFAIQYALQIGAHVFGLIWQILRVVIPVVEAIPLIGPPIAAILYVIQILCGPAGGLPDGISTLLPLFYAIEVNLAMFYIPFALALAAPIFIMGMTLGIYAPFIPYLLFTFATVSWFLSVVEGMVAGPLIALGVTHPEGHDFLGRAEQVIILLLSLFVRPSAILIGLIAGLILSFLGLHLLNSTFFTVFKQYLLLHQKDATIFAQVLIFLLIYTLLVLAVVNRSFSLIYELPEKVVRWIGGRPDQTSIPALLEKVKMRMTQAAEPAAQGASDTMKGKQRAITPRAYISKGPSGDDGVDLRSRAQRRGWGR